jgi:N-acetyl-alpha-D-glucosaminyl L-malate synthase BshA
MKIGMTGPSGYGGVARTVAELAIELTRRGHRVHLFTPTTPFHCVVPPDGLFLHHSMSDDIDSSRPLLVDWPARDFDRFLTLIFDVINSDGLDILHFHYAIPFASFSAAVRRRAGPSAPALIGTLHGGDVTIVHKQPDKRDGLIRILGALDALTTVSSAYARLALDAFDLRTHPVVIPNFVDLARFCPANEDSAGEIVNHPWPRIVHVSNFSPVKDTLSMAEIFLRIRERIKCELWLVGEGPNLSDVMSTIQQAGVRDDVRCWGWTSDVSSLLAQTSLLLMTSVTESFCMAALEAMACGVPVLAPTVGGFPELVHHRTTGYLFSPRDHAAAVNFATELLTNPVKHAAFKRAARTQAFRFGQGTVISMYENLYRSVMKSDQKYA